MKRWVRQKDFVWEARTGERSVKAYAKATVYRKVRKGEYLAKLNPVTRCMLFAVDERGDLIETTQAQRAALREDDLRATIAAVESSGSNLGRFLARLARVLLPVSVADPPKPDVAKRPDAKSQAGK